VEGLAIILSQRSIARSVDDNGLHASIKSSPDLLHIVTQEENLFSRRSNRLGNLAVACSLGLWSSIDGVKPLRDQSLQVDGSLVVMLTGYMTEEKLLGEDTARRVDGDFDGV